MNKKSRVNFDELANLLGEDEIINALKTYNTRHINAIEQATYPIWDVYFDVNLTAYILSFAFGTLSQARDLMFVCNLWHKSSETSIFWHQFLLSRFIPLNNKFQTVDFFHPRIWSSYKKTLLRGKLETIQRRNLSRCFYEVTCFDQTVSFDFTNNGIFIVAGRHAMYGNRCECRSTSWLDGTLIHWKNTTCRYSDGKFCRTCFGTTFNDETFRYTSICGIKCSMHTKRRLDAGLVTDGKISGEEFTFNGEIVRIYNNGKSYILPKCGSVAFDSDESQRHDFVLNSPEFWATYLRGLRKK